MFQRRNWILQRSNIELLRECQRIIQDLFSERLSLTQSDLIEKIFHFYSLSNNQRFHETVDRLKKSLVEAAFDISTLPGCAPPETVSIEVKDVKAVPTEVKSERPMLYRGRRVYLEVPREENRSSETVKLNQGEAISRSQTKRIYRGRVLE